MMLNRMLISRITLDIMTLSRMTQKMTHVLLNMQCATVFLLTFLLSVIMPNVILLIVIVSNDVVPIRVISTAGKQPQKSNDALHNLDEYLDIYGQHPFTFNDGQTNGLSKTSFFIFFPFSSFPPTTNESLIRQILKRDFGKLTCALS